MSRRTWCRFLLGVISQCFAVWVLGVVLYAAPASAGRIIGIVYDDSGSMAARINLPAFGAQVLASTLDGRPGQDLLITTRLSIFNAALRRVDGALARVRKEHPVGSRELIEDIERLGLPLVREEGLDTEGAHQQLLDSMRSDWARANGGTPYEPVELVLRQLVARTGYEDSAFLVILTDGAFFDENDDGPGRTVLERNFRHYKDLLKGSLRVDFVLIAPSDKLRGRVDAQGVRAGLLEVFNGDETDGSHVVENAEDLRKALFDITARISYTDTTAPNDFARIEQDRITIATPFSLSRITSIATGTDDDPVPEIVETTFDRQPASRLASGMESADTAEGWRNERLRAVTAQYRFSPPLPAGRLALRYDRSVDNRVSILFDIGTELEFAVRDDRGRPVLPNGEGVIELMRGRTYELESRLTEPAPTAGGRIPFDFANLPRSARIATWIERDGRRSELAHAPNVAENRGHGPLPTETLGSYAVGGTFSVPGFVVQEGRPLKLRVVAPEVAYDASVTGAPSCSTCRENQVRTEFRPGGGPEDVGRLTILQTAGRPSAISVRLRDAPVWLSVTNPNGGPLSPDTSVAISTDRPVTLGLRRDFSDTATLGPREVPFDVEIKAVAPLIGSATLSATAFVVPPDVTFAYVAHTRGTAADAPLALSGRDLENGDTSVFFDVVNAPSPLTPEQFEVVADGEFLDFTLDVAGSRLAVHATSEYSCCSLWILDLVGALPEFITVRYRFIEDVEPVVAVAPLRIVPTLAETGLGCLTILGYLLAILYGLLVVKTAFSANSFPKGSTAQIVDRNATLPRYEDLHRRSFRWLWFLFLKPAHERRNVEGIVFEARLDGAAIIVNDSDSAFVIERAGQSLGEMRKDQPTLTEVLVFWGERLSRPKGPKELTLVREFSDDYM